MTPDRGSTPRPDAPIRSVELPEGRYLSCSFQISPDAGGQTRALLLRNRILAIEAGVRPDVLTLTPTPDYYERQRVLLDRGLLIDEVGLLNIYEHYRTHGWGDRPSTGESLADLGTYRISEESRPDGTPWRIGVRRPGIAEELSGGGEEVVRSAPAEASRPSRRPGYDGPRPGATRLPPTAA